MYDKAFPKVLDSVTSQCKKHVNGYIQNPATNIEHKITEKATNDGDGEIYNLTFLHESGTGILRTCHASAAGSIQYEYPIPKGIKGIKIEFENECSTEYNRLKFENNCYLKNKDGVIVRNGIDYLDTQDLAEEAYLYVTASVVGLIESYTAPLVIKSAIKNIEFVY